MTDHTDVRTDARTLKRARACAEQAERHARRTRDQQRRWQKEGTYLTRAELIPECRNFWLVILGRGAVCE